MPGFNKRRINQNSLEIFKHTGRVIALLVRPPELVAPATIPRLPTDLLTAEAEPPDISSLRTIYIFAKFENTTASLEETEGRITQTTGIVSVPIIYRSILNATAYIDPYLNGSKFQLLDAVVDEESIFIYQAVKQIKNPDQGDVTF